jgi:hypothetical protein
MFFFEVLDLLFQQSHQLKGLPAHNGSSLKGHFIRQKTGIIVLTAEEL